MTEPSLPESVADFIFARIHSIEQLEVLLLLQRAGTETWTARRAAGELSITESLAQNALEKLVAQDLLQATKTAPSAFRYAPATAELARLVEQLASHHARARLDVVLLISRCAMERIRTAHVRAFAQAFLLKPRK